MTSDPVRVLFVCTGNICRSPTAEAVFRGMVEQQGLAGRIETDSAGTIGYHEGAGADPRTVEAARERGIEMGGLRARQVRIEDYRDFDLILAMSREHAEVMRDDCRPTERGKIRMFMEFAPQVDVRDVPDPYYGGARGFDRVLDLVEAGCEGVLAHVREELLGS